LSDLASCVFGIDHHADARDARYCVLEQIELLADQRLVAFVPETGDIAAGPRQAGGQPERRRVVARDHHDRDRGRRLVGLQDRCRRPDCDHGGLEGHQLVGERGQSRDLSVGEANGALHIAEITHPAAKGPEDVHPRGGGERRQQADERLTCRLLRARRERPRDGRAAEQRDELAPLHVEHGGLPPLCAIRPPTDPCARFSGTSACHREAG